MLARVLAMGLCPSVCLSQVDRSSNVLSTLLEKGGRSVDNTSEIRRSTTVVHRRDRQAMLTAGFCLASQFATADTCFYVTIYRSHCCPGVSISHLRVLCINAG